MESSATAKSGSTQQMGKKKKGVKTSNANGPKRKGQHKPMDIPAVVKGLIDRHKTAGLTGKQFSSALRKDIPYLLPEFGKGTQVVPLRLYAGPLSLATTNATAFSTVQTIDANLFTDFSDMASVFNEYRFIRGHVWYSPTTILTSESLALETGYAIAAIDYVSNTAFASLAAALSQDTHREFYFVGIHSQQFSKKQCRGVVSWSVEFEKLPDQDWVSTTNGDYEVAYWKPYMASAQSPGTLEVGKLYLWMDFQFRGLRA